MRWCEIRKPRSLMPFSHRPGVRVGIPGTPYVVKAFPTRLQILDEKDEVLKEHLFDGEGPIKGFTVFSDLERGAVSVVSDIYRYHILPTLEIQKGRKPPLSDAPKEELFLGSLKQLKWEAVAERLDPKEILPLWHRLGVLLSLPECSLEEVGLYTLIAKCRFLCEQKEHAKMLTPLMQLFQAGFNDTLVARPLDTQYQGMVADLRQLPFPAYFLLSEGAHLIRSFFYQEIEGQPSFLPHLPSECFSGSMHHIDTRFGIFHFRWTKKQLREVWLEAKANATYTPHFQKGLKKCRLRQSVRDRGQSFVCGESFEINSGHDYVWDRFEK
jgi:hypothetical protein